MKNSQACCVLSFHDLVLEAGLSKDQGRRTDQGPRTKDGPGTKDEGPRTGTFFVPRCPTWRCRNLRRRGRLEELSAVRVPHVLQEGAMPHELFGDVLIRPRSARPRRPSVVILSMV